MNYLEWADEYSEEASRVLSVINKKKELLNGKLTADTRKQINDVIIAYRCIYRELLAVSEHLRKRGGGLSYET